MCSTGLAYGLGVAQVVLLGVVVLCYPAAKVQTFVYTPCVVNGSLSPACGHVASAWIDLAPACALLSVLVAAYVIDTFKKSEAEGLQGDFTFSGEAATTLWHWDAHFWGVLAWAHCLAVFMLCSPVHFFTAVGAGGLMAYAMSRICRPTDPEGRSSASAFAGVLIYIAGALLCFQSIPVYYPNRYALAGGLLLLDYILGVGHTLDRETSMETVANCRVSYTSCCALVLAGAYAAWGGDLVVRSI